MSLWIVDRTALMIFGAVVTLQRMPQVHASAHQREPRSFGTFQLVAIGDAVLTPIPDDEAFWIGIDTPDPISIRIRINSDPPVDAMNAQPWSDQLICGPFQNYVVSPPQRAVNGVMRSDGSCRFFARVSRSPERYYACPSLTLFASRLKTQSSTKRPSMVFGSEVLPDPFGVDAWDVDRVAKTTVKLLPPEEFQRDTGLLPKRLDKREVAGRWRL